MHFYSSEKKLLVATTNRHVFVGREAELAQLRRIARLRKASLVVCRGRLRAGKSTLTQHFAQELEHFYEFQGLAPRPSMDRHDQLAHFSRQMAAQLRLPLLQPGSWYEAFELLARLTEDKPALIFLDEMSWMASQDIDFVGQLKTAWDTRFKKNRRLILVLCGSVSSWIDKNILNDTNFVGRVSLSIDLSELPLRECDEFFTENGGDPGRRMSAMDKTRLLCVTGGMPAYLEEIDYSISAERNIVELCFRKNGMLVDEFDNIFNDIFSARARTYKQIVEALTDGPRTFSEICAQLQVTASGVFPEYLEDLQAAGFVARDYSYSLASGRPGKLSRYRLKDNYLRFYLKYIEPVRQQVKQGVLKVPRLAAFDTIMGLQLQNLVLNNIPLVLKLLNIDPAQVRSASPYFQKETQRSQPCQIDLLIDTTHAVYICEIKFRRTLGLSLADEISEKARRLKVDPGKNARRVLIYMGELAPSLAASGAFDQIISFEDLLNAPVDE